MYRREEPYMGSNAFIAHCLLLSTDYARGKKISRVAYHFDESYDSCDHICTYALKGKAKKIMQGHLQNMPTLDP